MLPAELNRLSNERNTPGACGLHLVPVEGVATMPMEVNGVIPLNTPVILKPGWTWTKVTPTVLTQEFTESWAREMGATVARSQVSFAIPKDRVDLAEPFWAMGATRCLVINFDHNGNAKLMGTVDEPALVTVTNLQHGTAPGQGRNQYQLEAVCTRRRKCPFYLPASTPDPVPPPPGCPTAAQLLPGMLPSDLLGLLTPAQYAWFSQHFGVPVPCPSLAELLSTTSDADVYAALTPGQATYVANQLITVVDGHYGGGGGATPEPDYDPADYQPTDYATT